MQLEYLIEPENQSMNLENLTGEIKPPHKYNPSGQHETTSIST